MLDTGCCDVDLCLNNSIVDQVDNHELVQYNIQNQHIK